MKKLKISDKIKSFDGEVLKDAAGKEVTVKSCLINMLGLTKPTSGEDAIEFVKVGTELSEQKGEYFIFEEGSEQYIKRAIEQNVPNYTSIVLAAIQQAMDGIVSFKAEELDKHKEKEAKDGGEN